MATSRGLAIVAAAALAASAIPVRATEPMVLQATKMPASVKAPASCNYQKTGKGIAAFRCPDGASGTITVVGRDQLMVQSGGKATDATLFVNRAAGTTAAATGRQKIAAAPVRRIELSTPASAELAAACASPRYVCQCRLANAPRAVTESPTCSRPDCCATAEAPSEGCAGAEADCSPPTETDLCDFARQAADDPFCQAHPTCSYVNGFAAVCALLDLFD